MSVLIDQITTLRSATASLGSLVDPTAVLSAGFCLYDSVLTEYSLCGKAARELPGLGEMLVRGKRSYSETTTFINSASKSNLETVKTLRRSVEERHTQKVIGQLDRFFKFLEDVDWRLGNLEKCCDGVSVRSMNLTRTCSKHRGYKSATGGFLLFSGCFALIVAVAAFATKRTVRVAGAAAGGTAALLMGVPPMNTGLTGGLAAFLGARSTSHAAAHSRLAGNFKGLSEGMLGQTSKIRALRTRFQRLRNSVEQLVSLFRVQTVLGGLQQAAWVEMLAWVDAYEEMLMHLIKETAGTSV